MILRVLVNDQKRLFEDEIYICENICLSYLFGVSKILVHEHLRDAISILCALVMLSCLDCNNAATASRLAKVSILASGN